MSQRSRKGGDAQRILWAICDFLKEAAGVERRKKIFSWRRRDLNPGPPVCETGALPLSYAPKGEEESCKRKTTTGNTHFGDKGKGEILYDKVRSNRPVRKFDCNFPPTINESRETENGLNWRLLRRRVVSRSVNFAIFFAPVETRQSATAIN